MYVLNWYKAECKYESKAEDSDHHKSHPTPNRPECYDQAVRFNEYYICIIIIFVFWAIFIYLFKSNQIKLN